MEDTQQPVNSNISRQDVMAAFMASDPKQENPTFSTEKEQAQQRRHRNEPTRN